MADPVSIAAGMTPCPGCGLELPGSGDLADPRSTASAACRFVYGEVAGYEIEHVAQLGRWHQVLVDVYAAQHVGPATPRIGPAFALIGLHLALDRGWDGPAIRDAHQALGRQFRDWPAFEPPAPTWTLTVADLALAASPEDYIAVLGRWAAEVWAAWRDAHDAVERLVADRLPAGGL